MKKTILTLILFTSVTTTPLQADTVEELEQWFCDGYAVLFLDNALDHADKFARYFDEVITFRSTLAGSSLTSKGLCSIP